jgi:hypothetical protein
MKEWEQKLDDFLAFNERDVLRNAGKVSHDRAEAIAHERYATYDLNRRESERLAADAEHIDELTQIEKDAVVLKKIGTSKPKKKTGA